MKVAHIIDRLEIGGAETIAVNLANGLYERGIDITFITLLYFGDLENKININIKKYSLNRKNKFSLKEMKKLSQKLEKFDIIHIHMRQVYRYIAVVKILFNFNSKIIFHDHSGDTSKSINNIVFKYLLIIKPFYIGTSKKLTTWAKDYLKINKSNIFLLSNVIFETLPLKKNFENKVSIVMVGNIRKEKNILFAIKIMSKLHKDITLTIYGYIKDENYYEEIINLIKTFNLKDRIKIITNCNNALLELNKYSLAIHTSKFETGPLVLIEYLSVGIPFLSYNTGEVVNVLKKDFSDFIISDFQEDKWVDKINYFLDKKVNKETSENLYIFYSKNFSSKEYINKCKVIYNQIIDS